jgi:hypothetical protein
MRTIAIFGFVATLFSVATVLSAQEAPQPAAPEKEHQWLQQLVGEWEAESEAILAPGQPPMKCQGTESVRAIGGLWTVAETKNDFQGMQVTGVMTLGYDPQKKKYVGTWIDSMTNYLWKYEGALDEEGKILTLETEGPGHGDPGKLARFRETFEIKGQDHKVFTSSIQGEDGKWFTFLTTHYRRKK